MESAEIMEPCTIFAREMESSVFPTAVGPVKIINGFFMRLNRAFHYDWREIYSMPVYQFAIVSK